MAEMIAMLNGLGPPKRNEAKHFIGRAYKAKPIPSPQSKKGKRQLKALKAEAYHSAHAKKKLDLDGFGDGEVELSLFDVTLIAIVGFFAIKLVLDRTSRP